MRAARPESIRVKMRDTGKTVTLPYRKAVRELSLGFAELAGKKPGPRPKTDEERAEAARRSAEKARKAKAEKAAARKAAEASEKDDEDLIGLSAPASDAGQEGEETGNKPSSGVTDDGVLD